MSAITNSNDYKRGWEDGRKAAVAGENKDYSHMGKSWKFVIHGNKALDTYIQGYNDGYTVGIKEKNVTHKVQILNDNDMSQQAKGQDFLRELEALTDLNDFLVYFYDRVMHVQNQYKGYIQVMIDTGVPKQQCDVYTKEYFSQDEQNFKALLNKIENNDLPRIKGYIDQISGQLQEASGMSFNMNLKKPDSSSRPSVPSEAVSRTGGPQDLEKQADASCDLMDFLVERRDELHEHNEEYKKYCYNLLQNGVPQQYFDDYVNNFAQQNIAQVDKIALHMQDEDYPYLIKVFREIVKGITFVGGNYPRTPKSM